MAAMVVDEAVRQDLIAMVKLQKGGAPIVGLQKVYYDLKGEHLKCSELGFNNILELVGAIAELRIEDGVVHAVSNADTHHLEVLVQNTNLKKKKKRRRGPEGENGDFQRKSGVHGREKPGCVGPGPRSLCNRGFSGSDNAKNRLNSGVGSKAGSGGINGVDSVKRALPLMDLKLPLERRTERAIKCAIFENRKYKHLLSANVKAVRRIGIQCDLNSDFALPGDWHIDPKKHLSHFKGLSEEELEKAEEDLRVRLIETRKMADDLSSKLLLVRLLK
ncbi:unnamed protein product, partial [Notodromas monacha]